MKKYYFLLPLLVLVGCAEINDKLIEISFYNNPAFIIWNNKDPLCYIKNTNEIRIFNGIIENKIIENIYNKGNDVLTLSRECNADAVFFRIDDLLNIPPNILKSLSENYPIILSNIYFAKNPTYQFKKYLKKELNNKSILIASLIMDLKEPLKATYIKSGYRIENPTYELNRILSHKADFKIVIINRYDKDKTSFKEEKKFFYNFISKLDKKPEIIISDVVENMTIKGVKIIKLENKTISIYKKFRFLNKIEEKKIYGIKTIETPLTKETIKKTEDYFNKKLTYSNLNLNLEQTKIYIAKSIKKRIKSDFSVVCDNIVKNGIKKGEFKIKDLYSIITDYDERLIYLRVKGEKIGDFFSEIFKITSAVYKEKVINENDIKNTKFTTSKIYKILINENCLKNNKKILNYVAEFSVIKSNILDTMMWYTKNYGIKNEIN